MLNLFVPLFLNYYCYYFIRDIRIKREDVIRYSIECNGDRGDGAFCFTWLVKISWRRPRE